MNDERGSVRSVKDDRKSYNRKKRCAYEGVFVSLRSRLGGQRSRISAFDGWVIFLGFEGC